MKQKSFSIKKIMLLLAFALTACGGETQSVQGPTEISPEAKAIAQLENAGTLPKLDRIDSLAGPDADVNGVRDDIDVYLNNKYTDPKQKAAALQMAKAMQKSLLVNPKDKAATTAVTNAMDKATDCIFIRFPLGKNPNPHIVNDEVVSISTNTKSRLIAYLTYNSTEDGSVSSLSDLNESEAMCE